MKRTISIALLFAFCHSFLLNDLTFAAKQKSDKYSLAILNFYLLEGELTHTEARVLTSRFTDEITNASLFYTMDQDNMERGLMERGLDPGGCATFDCAIRAGKALGVQVVVFGTVRQTLTGFELHFEMVHVASRKIVQSLDEQYPGELDGLILSMPIFARKLIGLPVSETLPPPVQTDFADLPEVYETTSRNGGGGFKWYYLGLGLVVAGGIGAAVMLSGGGDSGGNTAAPPKGELPGAPSFP